MLRAFAESGRYLKRPDYTAVAIRNAEFLLSTLRTNDRLLRSWREGKARHNAYLEDYTALILALLALYQSDPQTYWFQHARELTDEMLSRFSDPEGGFFDTPADHEGLLLRPKNLQDNAVPSGNALAATALLHMAAYDGNGEWRATAEKMLNQISEHLSRFPTAFGQWLCAADFALGPVQEVAILGYPELPQTQALVEALWKQYRPRLVAAISEVPPHPQGPKLLADRELFNGQASAYVCQEMVCQLPVNTPAEMFAQIAGD